MYSFYTKKLWTPPCAIAKLLLIMRLTTIILITAIMQVSASSFAQKITLSERNAPLRKVFDKILSQSGVEFIVSANMLKEAKLVSIQVKDMELNDVLEQIFDKQELQFAIENKSVVVSRKPAGLLNDMARYFARKDLNGKVLDEKGNPLLGAVLRVKGNNKFAVTNENGRFSLLDVSNGDLVTVSYIGYLTKEFVVSDSTHMVISLQIAEAKLEEVVVVSTGYQNIPKERATGSFKVIPKEQLNKPASTLAQRLVGTTAGMAATVDANGATTFRVRGLTSLSASSDPLIVVDGFAIQGSIDDINPNNVESVTILKDAAAASIWGARSANGVIVITTKSGKKGVPFNAEITAFTRVASKMNLNYVRPFASSAETVDFEKLAYGKWAGAVQGGTLATPSPGFSQVFTLMNEHALGKITLQQRDDALNTLRGLDNKKQIEDELLNNPITSQVNLNMSGSTGKMNNALSLLYESGKTDFKGNENKRSVINYRNDAKLFSWLDFDMALMFQYQKSNNNGATLADIQGMSPYDMLMNEDGSYNTNLPYEYYLPTVNNLIPIQRFPYSDWSYNLARDIHTRNLSSELINGRIQAGLTAKIIPGLSLSSRVQYENFNTLNRQLYNEESYKVRSTVNSAASWNRTATGAVVSNLPKGSIMDQNRRKMTGYTWRNQLSFARTFATEHTVNFIAGTEIRSSVSEVFTNPTTYGYNEKTLTVGAFPNGPGGSGTGRTITNWLGTNITFPYTNSFTYNTDRYFSSFANLAYTFKNKYTLSGSFRTDASNLITDDPTYRYSPFWSAGGSWQVSREDFLREVSWLDQLTARVTYGYNGNEDRSTSFMPLINIGGTPNGITGETIASVSSYGNPTLRWEKTGTVNAGIDFSLFKGKLSGSIEGYNKQGRDLLADLTIPAVNGTTSQKLNNVKMYNRGVDIELGSSLKISRKINWNGNVTFSYNKNKITDLFRSVYTAANLRSTTSVSYVEGFNANTLWAYEYAGFSGGMPMVKGPDGTLISFATVNPIPDARTFMKDAGVSVAPYTLGMVNSFDLYNFNFSFIVTGKFGHVFRRNSFNYPVQTGARLLPNSRLSEVLNGDPSSLLTLPQNDADQNYKNWSVYYSYLDYLIESANHIRLQELSLAYKVKPSFLQKYNLSGLTLYAQGNDLLTIVANKYGEDPEYRLGTQNPRPRFTLGLKVQL